MKITENFEYIGTSQNFERDSYATLAEMKAVADKRMPDIFTATCKETGKFYIYNKNNEVDETLGKWTELSIDGDDYVTKTYLDTELAKKADIDHTHTIVNGHTVESDVPVDAKFTDTIYDDTDIKAEITKKADITSIPSKVSELTNDSNYQTAEQISSTVTAEIAKVVADAPENFDTLKEMSDWIAGHENDASTMNSAISDNKTAITALQSGKADKSEIPTTVSELTDSADYAKKTDIPTTLPANGGNADTVNNHTVESNVPTDAVFTDTTYETVTQTEDGLMSAADKAKLDGVEVGATKTLIDIELSSTSTNPVQNKVVTDALNNKADKSKYSDTTINVGRKASTTVGDYSTAEGLDTTASGTCSHAEGLDTTASGNYSHAEGSNFDSSGSEQFPDRKVTISDVEYTIKGSTVYGVNSHAEGTQSFAYGYSSHAEGVNTSAIGQGSHAEGSNIEKNRYNEIVFEDPRIVEIYNEAIGEYNTITVAGSQAFGLNSHAEGCSTLAYGKNSHTEGYHTVAAANESHAEGCGCEANKSFAHAEGQDTKANGNGAHAEGFCTTASGTYSHAEGYYTKAANYASHASGKYNAAMTTGGGSSNTTGTAFVIGNGTGNSALSNAFSVQFNGIVKAKSTITASTTADYAEFFEWLDKNPNEEDRVGHFVTLDGDKIKIATSEDDYILGIVSGEPFVLGNGDCDTWNGMYLHDEFRRTMYEPAPKIIEILDNEGNPTGEYKEVEGEYEGTRPILNPDYDPTQEYISRFDRVEWSPIGMLGVLAVLHDGTAEVNGYVTVNNEGIATKCTRDIRNSYRVIKKVSDKVVEVIFR